MTCPSFIITKGFGGGGILVTQSYGGVIDNVLSRICLVTNFEFCFEYETELDFELKYETEFDFSEVMNLEFTFPVCGTGNVCGNDPHVDGGCN